MSPLGHGSVSYLAARATRLTPLGVMAGGLWPDVDFLLLPLASFNQLHRGLTHSLVFVAAGAAVFTFVARRFSATPRGMLFAAFLAGGLLHLLVDACMDDNPTNGIGVAVFWPLSIQTYSPYNLLTPDPDTRGWTGPGYALRYLRLLWAVELPLALAAAAVFVLARRKRQGAEGSPRRQDGGAMEESRRHGGHGKES